MFDLILFVYIYLNLIDMVPKLHIRRLSGRGGINFQEFGFTSVKLIAVINHVRVVSSLTSDFDYNSKNVIMVTSRA